MITIDSLEQLVREGKSFSEISRITSTDVGHISRLAKKNGIKSTHLGAITVKPLPIAEIYDKYINRKVSLHTLHLEYNRPVARIKQQLLAAYPNISFRTMDQAKRHSILNDKIKLNNLLIAAGSAGEVAKRIKTKKSVVEAALCRLGLSTNPEVRIFKPWDGEFTEQRLNSEYYGDWFALYDNPNACYNRLLEIGFLGVCADRTALINALNHLDVPYEHELNANYYNPFVNTIITHFSQHYYKSYHVGYLPASAAWEAGNQTVLRNAIEKSWKRDINIDRLVKHIGRYFKDFSPVSIFKPWVARHIYRRYLPNGGVIVDPCMGWGGRLLGTIDLQYDYIGYDFNPNVISSHHELRKFVGSRLVDEPQFILADSSTVDFADGDLLFTSPPYDDCERYYGIDSSKTLTEPILDNIFRKFGGIIALNLPRRQIELCNSVAIRNGRILLEVLEMKTSSFMGREKTFEPILVFKSRKPNQI